MYVPILAYHKIQDSFDLGISYTKVNQFEKQVKFLFENGYSTSSFNEYLDEERTNSKRVIITFDDAYESVFENAYPILKKYNFTATLFVITKFVGTLNKWDYHFKEFRSRHLDWKQINLLAKEGWEVGSHTVSHPSLALCSSNQIWYELKHSKEVIENKLNKSVNIISYPFGKFNHKIINFVKKAGYQAGCTLGSNFTQKHYPYALCRRSVYVMEPFSVFKLKLTNNFWSQFDDFIQNLISRCSQSPSILRYLKNRGFNFLKSKLDERAWY